MFIKKVRAFFENRCVYLDSLSNSNNELKQSVQSETFDSESVLNVADSLKNLSKLCSSFPDLSEFGDFFNNVDIDSLDVDRVISLIDDVLIDFKNGYSDGFISLKNKLNSLKSEIVNERLNVVHPIVSRSLGIERYTTEEDASAKNEMRRLQKDFFEYYNENLNVDDVYKKESVLSVFEGDSERINVLLDDDPEILDELYKLTLLSRFLWENNGYIHEDVWLVDKLKSEGIEGMDLIIARSSYYKKNGFNNLHKTLNTKIGDCNRLGTIMIALADQNGIDLRQYYHEVHFSTAVEVSGEIFVLDTGDGKLYFNDDFHKNMLNLPFFNKEDLFQLGNEETIYLENLRDEFLSLMSVENNPEEYERILFLSDELEKYIDDPDLLVFISAARDVVEKNSK